MEIRPISQSADLDYQVGLWTCLFLLLFNFLNNYRNCCCCFIITHVFVYGLSSSDIVCPYMRLLTTLGCIFSRYADTELAATELEWCIEDVDFWMCANRLEFYVDESCKGPDQETACPCLAVFQCYSLVPTLLQPMTTSVYGEWCCIQNLILTNSSVLSVHLASTGQWFSYLQCSLHSLDIELALTLIHVFVTSCMDYCNVTTDKLQQLLNAAAHVVSGSSKWPRVGSGA